MQCKHCKRETQKRTGFCDKECTREFRAMEAKFRYDQERAARKAARQEKAARKSSNHDH